MRSRRPSLLSSRKTFRRLGVWVVEAVVLENLRMLRLRLRLVLRSNISNISSSSNNNSNNN